MREPRNLQGTEPGFCALFALCSAVTSTRAYKADQKGQLGERQAKSMKKYLGYCPDCTALPNYFDADEIGIWRNTILLSTNDTSNMRSMTSDIIVGLIRIF